MNHSRTGINIWWERSVIATAALFSFTSVPAAWAACSSAEQRLAEIMNTSKTPDTLVLAHRGYWGGGTPENSMGAIQAADNECMDGIELDVKMTKDGVPVLMHDFNLGRTTTIYRLWGGKKFDPMTNGGTNPRVADLNVQDTDRLNLLSPDRRLETGYFVPRVSRVLNTWRSNSMRTPLVFDIKTADAVRAVNALVRDAGVGGYKTMAVKVNATLYPDPHNFFRDANSLNPIPVFTTNMLGSISVADALTRWMAAAQTIEINVKQRGGLLSYQKKQAMNAGKRVAVFHALPDAPVANSFYKNTGACCYKLSDLFYVQHYNRQVIGRDTEDHRGDLNYLYGEGFGLITSDDPRGTVRFLARAGLRRHHFQDY